MSYLKLYFLIFKNFFSNYLFITDFEVSSLWSVYQPVLSYLLKLMTSPNMWLIFINLHVCFKNIHSVVMCNAVSITSRLLIVLLENLPIFLCVWALITAKDVLKSPIRFWMYLFLLVTVHSTLFCDVIGCHKGFKTLWFYLLSL